MKLKSKTVVPYNGEVVDLCVENSHTYNVESVAVHNSGGGSLVAYVLYITDLDPLKWDLPFARFLSVYRKGAPDIDCVHEDHLVVMANSKHKRAGDIKEGDIVLGGDGVAHTITATYSRSLRDNEKALTIVVKADDGTLGHLNVVPNHKFIRVDGAIVYAKDLKREDELMASCSVKVIDIISITDNDFVYVDITVENDHRFNIIPFDVHEMSDKSLLFSNAYA